MTDDIFIAYLDGTIANAVATKAALQPPPTSPVPLVYPNRRTDRDIAQKPALPALGPAGSGYVDPVFNSPITRLTDANTRTDSIGQSYRTTSTGRGIALDGSLHLMTSTRGQAYVRRFADAVVQPLPMMGDPTFGDSGHVVYGGSNGASPMVILVDLAASTILPMVVVDLTKVVSIDLNNPRTYARDVTVNSGVLSVLFGGTGQDFDHFVLWFPLDGSPYKVLDTLAGRPDLPAMHLHYAAVDMSGDTILLCPTAADAAAAKAAGHPFATLYAWNVKADTITPITQHAGGHSVLGYGLMVNAPDDLDGSEVPWRKLSDPDAYRQLVQPLISPACFKNSSHASWWNAQRNFDVPVFLSTFRFTADGPQALDPWRALDDEVIAVSTVVGATQLTRFCHHRSLVYGQNASWLNYWATPRVQVSPDGKLAIYTSNYEYTLGLDPFDSDGDKNRQDVFSVQLI